MENQKLGKTFKFLSYSIEKIVNKKLKEKDLSITQGIVLLWLNDESEKELPIKSIEKKFGKAQSTTLGIINRLEDKALVTSTLNESRSKIIKITEKGLNLVDEIEEYIIETDDITLSGFSEGEKMIFLELLRKAEKNLLQQHNIDMEDYYEK